MSVKLYKLDGCKSHTRFLRASALLPACDSVCLCNRLVGGEDHLVDTTNYVTSSQAPGPFRVRVRCKQVEHNALLLCTRLTDQQKPGLIDMKRREHTGRLLHDSYSQASAEPQKRFRTKNSHWQDATTQAGATAIVV
eukprot:1848753-Rhodomonas_salina.1